jgi:hypothetical protein
MNCTHDNMNKIGGENGAILSIISNSVNVK